jgi:hypothetical protein
MLLLTFYHHYQALSSRHHGEAYTTDQLVNDERPCRSDRKGSRQGAASESLPLEAWTSKFLHLLSFVLTSSAPFFR